MADMTDKETASFQVTDRRFWVDDESIIERSSTPEAKYPSFVEELKARTEAAEQKLHERLRQLDEENAAFRERLNRQIEKRVDLEKAGFLRGFLEILDNSERALRSAQDASHFESLKAGVEMNVQLLLNRLQAAGVQPIEVLNQPFDPETAEALGVVATDRPEEDNVVLAEIERGFRLGDLILRPAKVNVGRFSDIQSESV